MLTAPSRAWSVFQQMFAEHWAPFQHAHPRDQPPYDDGLVAQMLACGQPEQRGSVAYRCVRCGQGTHQVAMRGKSALG
jgi:hypothetical protein